MRGRILLLPEFEDVSQFQDVLARTVFHIGHAEPEAITFIVAPDVKASAEALVEDFVLPADFDPEIVEMAPLVADAITILAAGTPAADRAPRVSDVVAVWDVERFDESEWVVERGRRTPYLNYFEVDSHAIRLGASAFARIAERLTGPSIDEENVRFLEMFDEIGPAHDVLLFGSGPSVHEALDQDLPPGVRIVCNTVILDSELMDHVQPQILTFADPIFHFGPSVYAANFRSAVRRALAQHPEMWIVIPLRYRPAVVAGMPEHAARIVGIPMVSLASSLVLDLRERFGVNPYPNILTLMMLPLAATLGRAISLFGFDGRDPDDEAFWVHGAKVQLGDDMPAIRRVHPGFFDLDYEDYYATHVATVESFFQFCEERGMTVEGRSFSHMPCLKNRLNVRTHDSVEWSVPEHLRDRDGTIVVSIDPDWIGDFGHYGPWFRALAEENQSSGVATISLAARAVQESVHPTTLATFSYPSTNPIAANLYAPQFEVEIRSAIDHILSEIPAARLVLFFYTADVWHIPALTRLAMEHGERVRVVANLMRSHGSITQAAVDPATSRRPWTRAMSGLFRIAAQSGVTVTVDTDELANLLADISGVRLPVLPMVSVAKLGAARSSERSEKLTIYCPAQTQQVKGVDEFAEAARLVLGGPCGEAVEFRMRQVHQPARRDRTAFTEIERAAAAGVDVVSGAFDDAAYAAAIEDADIIVVPYRSESFRTRTSAVVVDAMRAGKPVIVAAGTWAAGTVDAAGAGVLFQSGDPEDLARAMVEAANRFDSLSRRAADAADEMGDRFSMRVLAEFLFETGAVGHDLDDLASSERLDDLEDVLASYVDGFQRGGFGRRAVASQLHFALMKRGLRIAALTSRCEELERAIHDRDARHAAMVEELESRRTELSSLQSDHTILQSDHTILEAEHGSLTDRYDVTVAWASELESTVATLEQGTGARIIGAAKRRLGG